MHQKQKQKKQKCNTHEGRVEFEIYMSCNVYKETSKVLILTFSADI